MQHLDEGTIHAWLDGQLPADEALAVEAHVADCRPCADAVAEARGLIAASSRILTALDDVPREVIPKGAAPSPAAAAEQATAPRPIGAATARARRRWFTTPTLAAAATIVVAVGTFTVVRSAGRSSARVNGESTAQSMAATSGPAADSNAARVVAPAAPSPVPAPSRAAAARDEAASTEMSARRALANAAPQPRAQGAREKVAESSPPQRLAAGAARAAIADVVAGAAAADTRRGIARNEERFAKAAPMIAPPPSKPDTFSVQILRGAKAEVQRFSVDSARADSAAATTGSVRGRVADANRTGLANVLVSVAGTSVGVTTDSVGTFVLRGVPAGAQRLLARRIGFAQADRTVTIDAGQTATADIVLAPTPVELQSVVVTGAAAAASASSARERGRLAASSVAPFAQAADTAPASSLYGCYDLGITPGSARARTGFRAIPRAIALDSTVVPARTDGVWYQVRDMDARAGSARDGVWRPAGPGAIEIEWVYGSRTARIRLSSSGTSMMRGTVEEVDRATATGDGGTVVAARRGCER